MRWEEVGITEQLPIMPFKHSFLLSFTFLFLQISANTSFTYTNGFNSSNLYLQTGQIKVGNIIQVEVANTTTSGLLRLTDDSSFVKGHAFYPDPIQFKVNGSLLSFSTTFVFGIVTKSQSQPGHGLVFTISPTKNMLTSFSQEFLGLFSDISNGKNTSHVVGVEFDTVANIGFRDIDNNHVGIDINSLTSVSDHTAGYYINNTFHKINLTSEEGNSYQVWITYDALKKQMNVTLALINMDKPRIPLLSLTSQTISDTLNDAMYIGFSASTGDHVGSSHFIQGWSFAHNTTIPPTLNISQLPPLPVTVQPPDTSSVPAPPPPSPSTHPTTEPKNILKIILPIIGTLVFVAICFYVIQREKKFSEVLEDWESEYGPHRFKYKDLYFATKGFKEKQVVGTGGFGKVYKGTLPNSNTEIAVKKVSHDSKQGMQEFVAEIVSIGRLRHRNLVQLLGYCRRKGELLLVYEFVPNGSLDKILHNTDQDSADLSLTWDQRFNIIKGVASGLLYIHEEWEQVVVHRDIKSSNVLLDSDLSARVGDFGLARLHDHGADPNTTLVKGTLGYLAPEHLTGHATPSVDVFSFGALVLEVVCGRRPIDLLAAKEDYLLVHMLFRLWKRGEMMRMVDPKMRGEYPAEDVEKVMQLGLLCSNVVPEERPTMREIVGYLDGVVEVPGLGGLEWGSTGLSFAKGWKCGGELGMTGEFPGSQTYAPYDTMFTYSTTISETRLNEGR